MSKTAETPKAEPQKDEPAATAPDAQTAAQEVEADRLWKEMASKHTDPHGSGALSEDQIDDSTGADGNEGGDAPEPVKEPETAKPAEAKAVPEAKNTPAQEDKSDTKAEKPDASKDAPQVDEKLWAKADKDPETAALKKLWEKASPEDRPAIEAHQRKYLERGQEIARHRSEKSATRKAAVPPAKKADEDVPLYDPAADEDLKKLKTDYPDVGEAVEKVISRAVSSVSKRADAKIAPIAETAKAHSAAFEEGELAKQNRILHDRHPNYTKVVQSEGFRDAFDNWLATKSDAIRAVVEENSDYVKDAAGVADVFDLFQTQTKFGVTQSAPPAESKVETKVTTAEPAKPATDPAKGSRRRQQLEGSTSIPGRGPGSSATPDKDDADAWYAHWASKKAREMNESVH